MIRILLSILILALAAGSASAQNAGETRSTAPQVGAVAPKAVFTLDTPIEALATDAGARAVLQRELPGLIDHERYDQFKTMSLKALKPFSGGLVTDERLAAVEKGLAALASPSDTPAPAEGE